MGLEQRIMSLIESTVVVENSVVHARLTQNVEYTRCSGETIVLVCGLDISVDPIERIGMWGGDCFSISAEEYVVIQ